MNRKTPMVVIKKTIYTVPAERVEPLTFRNYYHCQNQFGSSAFEKNSRA